MSIHQHGYEAFNYFDQINYVVGLMSQDEMTQSISNLNCDWYQWCEIVYSRKYTPILYQVSP
jgi:hypothetical protein